ncbi:MAG: 4-oxalocrotonate tautomerase family protein [Candidatus Hodarchaeota archaeon]
MPLIEMTFGKDALTAEQKVNLAKKVTDLVVQEAKQPKDYTWVVIHEEPMENWLVGGLTMHEVKAKMMQEKK